MSQFWYISEKNLERDLGIEIQIIDLIEPNP